MSTTYPPADPELCKRIREREKKNSQYEFPPRQLKKVKVYCGEVIIEQRKEEDDHSH